MNDNRVIIHADLNSFFATAEQQANPTLRGKPVGVVKGKGRTCIIAASTEAKKQGVGTGTRVSDAKKLCPGIILVPADFAKYEDISRRFIKICASYTPHCEVFSIDECFLDVTETEHLFGNVFDIAFDIKKKLRREVGDYLTCSVGLSHNKFLAKLASSQIKPDGLFWITEDNMLEVLDRTSLMDVCGLGFGLYNHLTALGIDSFGKIRSCPRELLLREFGPFWSVRLYNLSRGLDLNQVNSFRTLPEQKSVGRTYTTHQLLTKRSDVEKVMRNLCEEAAGKARQMGLVGRYVAICLREGHGGQSYWGHLTLSGYIDSGKIFFDLCKKILTDWPINNIIFCGVTLAMLALKKYQPIPLFEGDRKKRELIRSVDLVNQRFGDYTVFPAQFLGMPIVMPEVTGFFGDRKYQLAKFDNF